MLELRVERCRFGIVDEVSTLNAPASHGVDDAVDDLLHGVFTLRSSQGAAEILLRENVGGIYREGGRDFYAELLESH